MIRFLLVIGSVVALVTACDSSSTAPRPAPSITTTFAPGTSKHSVTVAGLDRTFGVYRPESLSSGPVPLVVMLHGAFGSASQAESSYGWDAEADAGHFVVAYPDGFKRSWNVADDCCGPPAAEHVGDVVFITTMVSIISASMPIDSRRIYATGICNGGMLAYRLACDTTIFAAIGADSSTMLSSCRSPAPISLIHIHGTADRTIPYTGGPGRRDNGGTGSSPVRIDGPPIPTLVERWRGIDHCAQPANHVSGKITTSVTTCPDGRAVELVTVSGAGHQWPGQPGPQGPAAETLQLDPPFPGLNATETIWDFLRAHPKPSGA